MVVPLQVLLVMEMVTLIWVVTLEVVALRIMIIATLLIKVLHQIQELK